MSLSERHPVLYVASVSVHRLARIGPTSARKGYAEGLVLQRGQAMAGVGGDLCQLSKHLHWMALHSPLVIAERHHHGFETAGWSKTSRRMLGESETPPRTCGGVLVWRRCRRGFLSQAVSDDDQSRKDKTQAGLGPAQSTNVEALRAR
ncbi:MAG: VanW family protein [Bacillota bacterium]